MTEISDGKYFMIGTFQGLADFGTTVLTSAGSSDAFVFGMAPL